MTLPPDPPAEPDDELPIASVRGRRLLSPIWAIPIVAVLIAAFLGWTTLATRGPEITITFASADGLIAGQTRVKHKSVEIGTVTGISLTPDLRQVRVRVRMRQEVASRLTGHTQFWVVRPRLTPGNISGLDTLVSGAYISMDPGAPGGQPKLDFTGLEEPPAIRSDQPGTTFQLKARRLGSLASGSPVIFHDIKAGEVLSYELDPGGNSVTLHVFVAAPYDAFVHEGTQFWNASGISVELGANGLRVRLASLLSAVTGGIAFSTPSSGSATPRAQRDASFPLYADREAAKSASFHASLKLVSYFTQSARGLKPGAPVEMLGLQVGTVTAVRLDFDPLAGHPRVAVEYVVQPERMFPFDPADPRLRDPGVITQRLLDQGLRVQLASASLLTGQQVLQASFDPKAPPVTVSAVDGRMVLPTAPGGLDDLMAGAGALLAKLNALKLDEVVANLNATLAAAHDVLSGQAVAQLPAITTGLQQALARTNKLLASADAGYGTDSPFHRDLDRLLSQIGDAARSIRLLADYLNSHPDALLRGRAGGRN
jgi:paraquat-inducible protein B